MLWPRLVLLMVFNLVAGTFKSFRKSKNLIQVYSVISTHFSNVSLQGHSWERRQDSGDRFQWGRPRETSTPTTTEPLHSENKERGGSGPFSLSTTVPNDKLGFVRSACAHGTTINLPQALYLTAGTREHRPILQPRGSWISPPTRITQGC